MALVHAGSAGHQHVDVHRLIRMLDPPDGATGRNIIVRALFLQKK